MLRAQVTAINKRKEIIFIRVIRCLNDNFDWALRRALAAVRTLLIINYRQVVIHMDGIILTLLDAECTADTSVIAFSLDSRSLFMGITLYKVFRLVWHQFNKVLRAGVHTFAAGNAFLFIYHRNAVHHMNGVKLTGSYTGTKSHTSKGAGFIAGTRNNGCHLAVFDTKIIIL